MGLLALAAPAWAADTAKTITGLGIGTGDDAIAGPDKKNGRGGSYVYYGKYEGTPTKYRVLAPSTTDFDGTTIKAYDGDDYYVTLTFLDEDTVTVKAGKRVKANIGTVLDGTYKRHYGK